MKILISLFLIFLSLSSHAFIFGEDTRLDYYQVPTNWQSWGKATLSLFSNRFIDQDLHEDEGIFKILKKVYFKNDANFCTNVRFQSQTSFAFCSGVLVGPDILLTARHCVENKRQCMRTFFVQNYFQKAETSEAIPQNKEVYYCDKILDKSSYDFDGPDWILIRLDRRVVGATPLKVAKSFNFKNSNVVAIGNPMGLPLKYSTGENALSPYNDDFFYSKLATFPGNSGGPVINTKTGELIGLTIGIAGDASSWQGEMVDFQVNEEKGCLEYRNCIKKDPVTQKITLTCPLDEVQRLDNIDFDLILSEQD